MWKMVLQMMQIMQDRKMMNYRWTQSRITQRKFLKSKNRVAVQMEQTHWIWMPVMLQWPVRKELRRSLNIGIMERKQVLQNILVLQKQFQCHPVLMDIQLPQLETLRLKIQE